MGLVPIDRYPDAEIILDLYTMWDVRGDGSVPLLPFFVGLGLIANQRGDTLESVLQFALKLAHVKDRPHIDGSELLVVLRSK